MDGNNIFLTAENPVAKYMKTVRSKIAGFRLHPENQQQVGFVLESDEDPDTFDYDREVLELYSDKEVRFFKQANKKLIEAGLLKPFTGDAEDVRLNNLVSDDELEEVVSTSNQAELKARLTKYTSLVVVERALTLAKEMGRPRRILTVIEQRKAELQEAKE